MSIVRQELKTVPIVNGIYYPSSTQEIKLIIEYAKKNRLTVRVAGAEHAPTSAIYSSHINQIKVKLDGDLKKIKEINIDDSKEYAAVTVGAGCYLGVNPSDQKSTLENSFTKQLDDLGFSLPNLGGISHQTIFGFMTGSSGGTLKSLHDTILSIKFIDGNGIEHIAHRGDDLFNAVGVSLGLLGIITELTFKCSRKYLVHGTETNKMMTDKSSYFTPDEKGNFSDLDKALFEGDDYIHFNLYPYLQAVTIWQANAIPYNEKKLTPYNHVLSSPIMTQIAALDLKIIDCLIHADDEYSEAIQKLQKPFVPLNANQEFTDIWYDALPVDNQVHRLDSKMDMEFSELWFPRDQLSEVMRRINKLFAENPKAAGNLPTEFYAASESPFWLSPSHGYTQGAFRVDLYWWNNNKNRHHEMEEFFGRFYEALHDVKGLRFHWGKHLPTPGKTYGKYTFFVEHLSKNYEKWNDFLKLRLKMDPDGIFLTEYWAKQLGIDQANEKIFSWTMMAADVLASGSSYLGLNFFSRKQEPITIAPYEDKINLISTKNNHVFDPT